jgi:hypothetical protein
VESVVRGRNQRFSQTCDKISGDGREGNKKVKSDIMDGEVKVFKRDNRAGFK